MRNRRQRRWWRRFWLRFARYGAVAFTTGLLARLIVDHHLYPPPTRRP